MSAQDERHALTLPPAAPALYDLAVEVLAASPDGLPPRRGGFLQPARAASSASPGSPAEPGEPPEPGSRADLLPRAEALAVLREALHPLPAGPAALHRRLARPGLQDHHRYLIRQVVAELPLPAGRSAEARTLARRLVRTGTTTLAVTVGLLLLARTGEPEDVPQLAVLGRFREFTGPAVDALDLLDRPTAGLVHLGVGARRDLFRPLLRALRAGDDPAVRAALLALPDPPRELPAATARRIVEASRLPGLMDRHPADPDLLALAGALLVRMASSRHDPADLLACRGVLGLYRRVVTAAARLPATVDNAAMLLSLALDLSSGAGVLLDWPPGTRTALLESLGRLLAQPRWAAVGTRPQDAEQRPRAAWIRRVGRRPFERPDGGPGGGPALRVEVVAGDPAERAAVETRILIDGRPVVPALFGRGPAEPPEALLEGGLLRAAAEPREVRLAEAACAEGCCGALYVTIRRVGGEVVWDGWRSPWNDRDAGEPDPGPPARRFDAAAYDAEVARAESDDSWSWPARRTARLVTAALDESPGLLGRWGVRRGWIGTDADDPDVVVVTFWRRPGEASGEGGGADGASDGVRGSGRPQQFRWTLPDDGTPPQPRAAAILRRLAEEDPTVHAQACG
ncbi:hypothetical protein ACFYUY_26705 [Kitasatospora sp. NPDC004745]|uniref:hypothetical protein n=1 Tax=Kitasatospora sp. NPDC004745 TaxID=3364019 RepID=UPI0036C74CA3